MSSLPNSTPAGDAAHQHQGPCSTVLSSRRRPSEVPPKDCPCSPCSSRGPHLRTRPRGTHLHCTTALTALQPSLHYSPHCTTALTALRPSLHYGPHCTTALTALRPSLHYSPHCTTALTALQPSLHYGPHCTTALTALQPSLHYSPHCTMALTALWPSLHYGPHCTHTHPSRPPFPLHRAGRLPKALC